MSEFENDEMVDETEALGEDVEADELDADEELDVDDEDEADDDAEPEAAAEEPAAEEKDSDEVLIDKVCIASRLLRARRSALRNEQEEKSGKTSTLVRALKLLELKPKMEQKEMSELLGMRLRELDAVLAEAEKNDIVARIEPEEPDMRKVVVMADADAIERAEALERKGEALVPGLSDEDTQQLIALLDKVIDPLEAMGLDEHDDRGPRGGFGGPRGGRGGDRGGFRGDRGGRGGRDDRGGRGGRGGFDRDRGGRDDRGGFRSGRDDRGGRGYDRGGRDDRGGFRGGRDDRNDRGGFRGGRDSRDDRGGYRSDRGGRDDRGPRGFSGTRSSFGDRNSRDDRGNRNGGGFKGGNRY